MAFGAGRRVCLGESLAKNRLFLFSVSLLQNFSFHPENTADLPDFDPRLFSLGIVLHPGRVRIKAATRNNVTNYVTHGSWCQWSLGFFFSILNRIASRGTESHAKLFLESVWARYRSQTGDWWFPQSPSILFLFCWFLHVTTRHHLLWAFAIFLIICPLMWYYCLL